MGQLFCVSYFYHTAERINGLPRSYWRNVAYGCELSRRNGTVEGGLQGEARTLVTLGGMMQLSADLAVKVSHVQGTAPTPGDQPGQRVGLHGRVVSSTRLAQRVAARCGHGSRGRLVGMRSFRSPKVHRLPHRAVWIPTVAWASLLPTESTMPQAMQSHAF